VARLLTPWGVPPVAARLYGYLLLCSRPISLDQITEDLEISKSSASVAARLLESYTLARRHSQPGTKRALYAVADDYEAMIRQQNRLLDAVAESFRIEQFTKCIVTAVFLAVAVAVVLMDRRSFTEGPRDFIDGPGAQAR